MTDFYVYEDQVGKSAFRVKRFGDKNFAHEHPANGNGTWLKGRGDSELLPYRLPEVLAAIDKGQPVYVCEGEKDADTAALQGVVATTNSGGAGKWRKEHSIWLRGAEPVIVIWDRDEQGQAHALQVSSSLRQAGVSDIRFRRAAAGKDLTDHIKAGLTLDDLVKEKPKPQKPKPKEDAEPASDDDEFLPTAFRVALDGLEGKTLEDAETNQWNAICPAHDDERPSLTIRPGGPGDQVAVLVHCFGGCSPEEVARALKINPIEFTVIPSKRLDDQEKANKRALEAKKARVYADEEYAREIALDPMQWGDDQSTGADELLIPFKDEVYLIDELLPYDGNCTLAAEPKVGKTRFMLGLVKAWCDDEPFLNYFDVNRADHGRLLYLNYDMPADLFRRWLHDLDLQNPDLLIVKHFDSGLDFPFWVPSVRDDFAQYCARMNVQMVVFDTQIAAMEGLVDNENDNMKVQNFYTRVKEVKKAGGVGSVFMVHHVGKADPSQGRGASTMKAWGEAQWILKREGVSHDSPRVFSSEGRDAGLAPVELEFNMENKRYSYTGAVPGTAMVVDKNQAIVSRFVEFHSRKGRWPKTKEAEALTGVAAGKRKDKLSELTVVFGLLARERIKDGRSVWYEYSVPEAPSDEGTE